MGDRIAQLFIEILGDGRAAVKALDSVKGGMQGIQDKAATLGAKMDNAFTGMAKNAAILTGAIYAGKKAYDATVGKYVDYATAVREMTRLTGMNSDEASRFIQVADDVFITTESMTTALTAAARNGIAPNIENIAKLSDEYLALQPGLERDQFLLERFGRSGMDMAALLEQGAGNIKAAFEGIDASLIIDPAAEASVAAYKTKVDELGDAWTSVKNKAAAAMLPQAEAFVTLMSDLLSLDPGAKFQGAADAAAKFINSTFDTSDALRAQRSAFQQSQQQMMLASKFLGTDYVDAVHGATNKMDDFNETIFDTKYASEEVGPVLDDYKSKYMNNKRVSWIVNFSINGGNPDAAYNYMIDGVVGHQQ
jgi:hypothetical protein